MKRMWNETLIIEAIKTCRSSSEVHKRFSGGWKWLRRNNRFDLLSHLNKTVYVHIAQLEPSDFINLEPSDFINLEKNPNVTLDKLPFGK